jgi:hypothetical protein
MERLSDHDVRGMLGFLHEAAEVDGPEAFTESVVETFWQLIPADAGACLLDRARGFGCYRREFGFARGTKTMRAFIIACAAAIVIAVIGGYVLNTMQEPADQAFTSPYARLGA